MLQDFIFSEEGYTFLKKYNDLFGVSFRMDVPDGENTIFERKEMSYRIDNNLSIGEFKKIIQQSIKENEDLLLQRFKNNVVKHKEDVFY